MQHLFNAKTRSEVSNKIVPVPWLGFDHDISLKKDPVFISEYPIAHGWTAEQLETVRKEQKFPNQQTLAFLQSFLFFGALESAYNYSFDSANYVIEQDGKQFLDTSELRHFLQSFAIFFKENTDRATNAYLQIRETLKVFRLWSTYFRVISFTIPDTDDAAKADFNTIYAALNVLGETIQESSHACESCLRDVPPAYMTEASVPQYGWEISDHNATFYREQLRLRGWCPSFYPYILRLGLSTLQVASVLDSGDHKDHTKCEDQEHCIASNVDLQTYKLQHREKECKCSIVSLPVDEMKKTLEDGKFPLIDGGTSEMKTVAWEPGMKFLTFSHVWSDGLGSTMEKGLPQCQIDFLCSLAACAQSEMSDLTDTALFWIDSLCIPEDDSLRKSAIGLMAKVYENSCVTVVLDSNLSDLDFQNCSVEEMMLRLAVTPWNRRLWTLQEGILSRNLFYQTSRAVVSSAAILSAAEECIPIPAITFPRRALSRFHAFENRESFREETKYTLGTIVNMLSGRTSSKLSDETLAIAALLRRDPSNLYSLPHDARMGAFFKLLRKVNQDILFFSRVRLEEPGLRWAPKTFLTQESRPMHEGSPDCVICETGLMGSFLFLKFDEPIYFGLDTQYLTIDDEGIAYRFAVFPSQREKVKPFMCDALIVQKKPTIIESLQNAAAICKVSDGDPETLHPAIYHYEEHIYITVDKHKFQSPLPENMRKGFMLMPESWIVIPGAKFEKTFAIID